MNNQPISIPAQQIGGSRAYVSPLKHTELVDPYKMIKNGIWVYYFLVIFEGALRKWVLPGLSTPLLIVRDPVAIFILLSALQRKMIPPNPGLVWIMLIGFLSILLAIGVGHGSVVVALYGGRIMLIHVPLIYIMGNVLSREDVLKIGRVTMWLAIPMVFLIALQFFSPQSAWVNRGLAGDLKGAGFSGANGYFRPPGTFSFTTGNTQFWAVVICFVFYFLLNPKDINRIISWAATASLIAAIPLSISRSMFFQLFLTGIFVLIASARKSNYIGKVIFGGIIIVGALYVLSQYSFFQTATGAFTARFTNASTSEGGVQGTLIDRYLGGLVEALSSSTASNLPFFGYGTGIGTNVGSIVINGRRGFFISEGEWGREIAELGPLMGLIVVFIRVGLTLRVTRAGYRKLLEGDSLPWILLSLGIVILSQGGWAQPSALGFFVIIGGLVMAATKTQVERKKVTPITRLVPQ